MNSIKIWFIVNWELFCRWLNRKEEYKYTICFFIGMYFREKNQSNNATKEELDKIGIVDIEYKYSSIVLHCTKPDNIDNYTRYALSKYLQKHINSFSGMVFIEEYRPESLKSLHSYKCVCKDFDGNDDIQYDF